MVTRCLSVHPGNRDREVLDPQGEVLSVPPGWVFLPAGDAALTRRVKEATDCWQVQVRYRGRLISRGIWADGSVIAAIREALVTRRQSATYQKGREQQRRRRDERQERYVEEFRQAVLAYLDFAPCHQALAEQLARAVTELATPIGSGTVARTARLPLARRVEGAVIAWLRHQTTEYEQTPIARVRGRRRALRRELAQRSRGLLARYRRGEAVGHDCPLKAALRVYSQP